MQKLEVEGQGIKTTTEFLHSSVQELKAVVWSQVFSLLGQPRTTEVGYIAGCTGVLQTGCCTVPVAHALLLHLCRWMPRPRREDKAPSEAMGPRCSQRELAKAAAKAVAGPGEGR